MRRAIFRAVPVAVLTAATVGTLAVPAHAETTTIEDVVRDVTYGQNGNEVPPGTPVEPGTDGEPSADLRSATLVHGVERITVVVRVRNLALRGGVSPNAAAWMRTPDGEVYRVNRAANRMDEVYSAVSLETQEESQEVCGATGRRSVARDEITFTFDRECLGDPAWLRFGAGTANSSDDVFGSLVDDARRNGGYEGARARIAGPRVYAGRRG